MIDGEKILPMLAEIWKKLFIKGIFLPSKMRFRDEGNDEMISDRCNIQLNENNEIEANSNLLKRQVPNQFRYMIPFSKESDDLFVIVCLI